MLQTMQPFFILSICSLVTTCLFPVFTKNNNNNIKIITCKKLLQPAVEVRASLERQSQL